MSPLFTSILVSGPDARVFLQGQLSCDMDGLTRDVPTLACLNSAQGRVQAVLRVTEVNEGFVLRALSEMVERAVQRLRKYVLRSKVVIDTPVASVESGDESNRSLLAELRAGIPHIFPATYETFVAQMLNLDILGAISFEKGCYTGQEIIARTHYRGAIKRRMFRFAIDGPPPAPATRLLHEGAHAGDVVYAMPAGQGSEFLAVLNLSLVDSVIQLEDRPDVPVQRLDLPYPTIGTS